MGELDAKELEELIKKATRGDERAEDELVRQLERAGDEDDYRALDTAYRAVFPEDADADPVPPPICEGALALPNFELVPAPLRVVTPRDASDLEHTIMEGVAAWRTMRAMSAGHAFSNVISTRDWMVATHVLATIEPVAPDTLVEPRTDLVRIGAGVTVEGLNSYLADQGRVMLNMPGYEKLSVVGVTSTGGHGAGIGYGPLCEHVLSLDLWWVDERARLRKWRIERSAGVSKSAPDDVELKADDDLFNACVVSAGMFGVIASMAVRTQPRKLLKEKREHTTWAKFRADDLPAILARPATEDQTPGAVHSVHLWLCPYEFVYKDEKAAYATKLTYTWAEDTDEEKQRREHSLGMLKLGAKIVVAMAKSKVSARRRYNRVARVLCMGLRQVAAFNGVMPFERAVNFGPANRMAVDAASCGIDAEQSAAHIDRLIAHFQREGMAGRFATSPIGMRWVDQSNAFLAPQFGRRTCMVEVPILAGTPTPKDTLNNYLQFAMSELGARPHWGQHHELTAEQVRSLYATTFTKFQAQFLALNPSGCFDNALTEQLQLRPG